MFCMYQLFYMPVTALFKLMTYFVWWNVLFDIQIKLLDKRIVIKIHSQHYSQITNMT